MRAPNSREELSADDVVVSEAKLYQIIPSKKKAPIIEIRDPNEERVFHFWKLSG